MREAKMMNDEKFDCFMFEVKSFVMNADGQGRSYRRKFLYSANPKDAWESVEEKISDEANKEPGRDKPCRIAIWAYVGNKEITKKVSVKDWEGVRKAYEKWFEKTVA